MKTTCTASISPPESVSGRVPLSEQGLTGSTAIVDDVVYVPSNIFEAYDLETGAGLWQFAVDEDDGASTPTIAGDKILFQGSAERIEARLYCLDRHTGRLLWEADAGGNDAAAISPGSRRKGCLWRL